ncbi:MAG TPA: hypothetical protein VM369_03550 [Candidatus Binatia bacterium]|nr:hypothetical protein [Candidatus Binatia bacterium]
MSARGALEAELGGAVQALDVLDDAAVERLTAQIRQAKQRQEKALRKAFDDTLSHLPALLRGPVRQLFRG